MTKEQVAPWYRQFWFWFVFAPPLVSIVLGLSLVAIAVTHGDSLVADNYDEVGRAIHKSYAREHEAAALGIRGSMVVDREQGRITVRLDGDAELPERLRLELAHPTHAQRDVAVELRRDATGLYRADARRRVDGRHYVRVQPDDGSWLLATEIEAGQRELALTPRRGG